MRSALAVGGLLVLIVFLCVSTTERPAVDKRTLTVVRSGGGTTEEREPRFDDPDKAAQLQWLKRAGPAGTIPPNALVKAKAEADALRLHQRGSSPISWRWLGPGNIGGRIRAISIHPYDENWITIGSASGGIWSSYDGGNSWFPRSDFIASLSVTSLVRDPTDPNVLYAGTGEALGNMFGGATNMSNVPGAGIFRSPDGGDTWTQLASTSPERTSAFQYVHELAIAPLTASSQPPPGRTPRPLGLPPRILAATNEGLFQSSDSGMTFRQCRRAASSVPVTEVTADVKYHPTDPTQAVAGGAYGIIWYSRDGGLTWRMSENLADHNTVFGDGRVELAYAKSDLQIVYALGGSVPINHGEGALYKSTDGGQTFLLVTATIGCFNGQGDYNNALWVDPTDPSVLLLGGTDLLRTTDGGDNLVQIAGYAGGAHPDQHVILSLPTYGPADHRLYIANDGGIFRAANALGDVPIDWQNLNHGLGITQFYGAAVNSAGDILGGTQDNGTIFGGGGHTESWYAALGGDGGFAAVDPNTPTLWYGESQWLHLQRWSGSGTGHGIVAGGSFPLGDAVSQTCNFIAPFILDPNRPKRLLAGGAKLWRCDNAADPPNPEWHPVKDADAAAGNISAIAIQKNDSNVIWVGHNLGKIYKTTTGGAPWTLVSGPPLPDRWVSDIELVGPDTAYVTYMGYSTVNVWKTDDGGQNWTCISDRNPTGRLPALPVSSIAVGCRTIFVGTDLGVFSTDDDGQHWTLGSAGPVNVQVDQLFWKGQDRLHLYAATFGRGIWKADVSSEPPPGGHSTYQVVDLIEDLPYETNVDGTPLDINDRNEVVFRVEYDDFQSREMWVWHPNGEKTLIDSMSWHYPPGSSANGLNDTGVLVGGSSHNDWSLLRPFAGDVGNMLPLSGYDDSTWGLQAQAMKINNIGAIVGYEDGTPLGGPYDARTLLWDTAHNVSTIPTPADTISWGVDISDEGQVTGQLQNVVNGFPSGNVRPYFWDPDGTFIDIGHLPGGFSTQPWAINNAGIVVGRSIVTGGHSRAFKWSATGGIRELDGITRDGAASGINDCNRVVGVVNGPSEGFVWDATNGPAMLLSRLDAESAAAWSYIGPVAINNNGWIAAVGYAIGDDELRPIVLIPIEGGACCE
jgi:probable HAF family extracellular repeat protein